VGFLVFANVAACRALADLPGDAPAADALSHPAVRQKLAQGLQAMRSLGGGSSTHAARALLMSEPPSVDAGEITDKGYINQSAVLARRAALVRQLEEGGDGVVLPAS
jgi:feruloyl-CoA synthase